MDNKVKVFTAIGALAFTVCTTIYLKNNDSAENGKIEYSQSIQAENLESVIGRTDSENSENNKALNDFFHSLSQNNIKIFLGRKESEGVIGNYLGKLNTEYAQFDLYHEKDGESGIAFFRAKGLDDLGNPRNLKDTLEGDLGKRRNAINNWINTNLYPIKTSKSDIIKSVSGLVESYPGTTDCNYLLEDVKRAVSEGNELPFYTLTFTTEEYFMNKIGFRPEVSITVRNAGQDISEGEVTITKFNHPGYIFKNQ